MEEHIKVILLWDGSHQLVYLEEVPQSGCGLSSLQNTVLSGYPVNMKWSSNDENCSSY